MKTTNIAIFENNDEFMQELKSCFSDSDKYKICLATSNGNTAIEQMKSISPDIAIVDLVLSGLDGFGVLDYIKNNKPSCICIAIGSFSYDKIINEAIEHGAVYYLLKPVNIELLKDRVEELSTEKAHSYNVSSDVRDKRKVVSLEEKISNIFITIGIPPHIKGYSYLREGVKMAVEEPSIINKVTKELYPNIGVKFNTTASKVERAIRHAIEVAWNRGRAEAINSIFGPRVYIGDERPTNSEFIALVADRLLLEMYK